MGIKELLIVSLSPQNLERDVLWFSENLPSIKKARIRTAWWRDNAYIIEKNLQLKPSELIRRLVDLGYERSQTILGKGLFAVRGGIVEIWPINTEKSYLIEFSGNVIAEIQERETNEEKIKPRVSQQNIEKLEPGSYVVHVDHGIGIFRGKSSENQIRNSNTPNVPNFKNSSLDIVSNLRFRASDFFIIEYAAPLPGREPDRLYVPVDQKNRLSPYVGFETPRIHRLGGTLWFKTKRKTKEDAEKLAKELLELYAKRHTARREPYTGDQELETGFRATFSFTETEDQLKAEKEIIADLEKPEPMDRILCGDVGFGKTEVAIRAALRVISSGKQTAILSPTTILTTQHEKTFRERLGSEFPIAVAALSRLTPRQETKKILRGIAEGKIDCVIGTHRLLSKDVKFKNLGLVVIDEEQRFGVKQKEYFKNLRAEIDILSLSATPIPRTLSLALAKLRDISILKTPPPERLPIKTFVLPYSKKIIARATQRELTRKGQIYFLHNRIETLEHIKEKLARSLLHFSYDRNKNVVNPVRTGVLRPADGNIALPSAISILNRRHGRRRSNGIKTTKPQIGIIHGRMKEKEIVKTMNQFQAQEINILLATTIIENGLDISNANTLIVDDATRLGLAEAHQLRGRIGRGNVQAFAYFLYKPSHLTDKAAERLEALQKYSELGSGYQIALRDLDIRGAGNVIGKEQSGAINRVGLNLYCQMLGEAIEELKHK